MSVCALVRFICVFLCVSTGEAVKDETDKTVKVEPNKSASDGSKKTAAVAGQRAVKVAPLIGAVQENRDKRK